MPVFQLLFSDSRCININLQSENLCCILLIHFMPIIFEKEINADCKLAVWEITEPAEWFKQQLLLNDTEENFLSSIKNEQRRMHWLSSRVLLRTLLNTNLFIEMENDENGKPVVTNFEVHVSLSHSHLRSALILNHCNAVGIDIEMIDPKIEKVAPRFVNSAEQKIIAEKNRMEDLFRIWCAKEAAYKWYGKKQLDFKNNLSLQFSSEEKTRGKMLLKKQNLKTEMNIGFKILDQYMLAWAV